MKRITIFLLITLSASILSAKTIELSQSSQIWNSGRVVLKDGTALEGVIKYDLRADAVHLKADSVIRTFVASQIIGFNFVQENIEGRRFFVSLPYEVKQGYERPTLFEVIYTNNISLLAREEDAYSSWTKLDPTVELRGHRRRANTRLYVNYGYDYYLSDSKGKITTVERGVKGVARSFNTHYKELRAFIRRNKLSVKSVYDMARLVDYYNSIEL